MGARERQIDHHPVNQYPESENHLSDDPVTIPQRFYQTGSQPDQSMTDRIRAVLITEWNKLHPPGTGNLIRDRGGGEDARQ